jgi:hypothetical protein
MYELMHEADTPENRIAEKYDVPTFDQYKTSKSAQENKLVSLSKEQNWTPMQELAFTLVYAIHCGGDKPRYIIINRQAAMNLLNQLGDVPKEIEDVPLAFNETGLFKYSWLA